VFRYDDASRALVLRFKHGDRTGAVPHFARWMARAGAALLAEAEVIVPVPLHPWRLWRRRYNQAAMLALAVAREAEKSCVPDALARIRATPSQGRLGRGQRTRNVRGAFRLRRPEAVEGRRVLLVDDVLTTGATVEECVRVLKRGGAADVDVLTLARVVLVPDFEIAENTLYS
jgi:ComF family protein